MNVVIKNLNIELNDDFDADYIGHSLNNLTKELEHGNVNIIKLTCSAKPDRIHSAIETIAKTIKNIMNEDYNIIFIPVGDNLPIKNIQLLEVK